MPMGFFLPLFFPKTKRFFPFLFTMIIIIAIIELTQLLFMLGSFDIDDLILNISGAILIYVILKLPPLQKIINKLTLKEHWQ